MATRRIIASEKTFLDKDDPVDGGSAPASGVPRAVVMKLLAFTLAMVVVPIGGYFLTVHTVFQGNSSYAGGLAALLANVVLIGYVVVALNEEDPQDKGKGKGKETKKEL